MAWHENIAPIAAKPDTPAFIKQHEMDAAVLRGKLK
jgi:hypothetical protein